ncbi:MAG: TldD/PmbA family protein [Firmicutes bacterium]|nr:TldD/PmbA family protein [Bacillota bacterium]
MKAALDYCKQALLQAGVDKFQCTLTESQQYEMNLEGTEFTLIRTLTDNTLGITLIKDNRRGSISINRLGEKDIDEAIETALELLNSSQPDPDYDIAPQQDPQQFVAGPQEPDTERMYQLLKEYTQQVPALFPAIKLMETIFVYNHSVQHFINSNGVDFVTTQGVYTLQSVFSSKDGEKTTSFNYSGFALKDLEDSLLEQASLKGLLRQSVEHLEARPLTGKFVGDVIITPDCLNMFIQYYMGTFLGDRALIAGTSPLKDKLGEQVAASKLTLSAQPVSPDMAAGYFVTGDGFAAENVTYIENGVLKSFLLSQYGSKKTGLERAKNSGGCWVIEPGDKSLDEMIAQVERGILLARYSGNNPSPNGDFSGVAKNSYYIENGKIMYPVNETMVSGNLAEVFKNIKDVSAERTDFGMALLPYVLSSGVTISGK